jgi:hypothetical protein
VLNGIAYDAKGDRLFVTGKNWPKLFESAWCRGARPPLSRELKSLHQWSRRARRIVGVVSHQSGEVEGAHQHGTIASHGMGRLGAKATCFEAIGVRSGRGVCVSESTVQRESP